MTNLIDLIGAVQGLIFGLIFIANSKKYKPFLFFGLFVLAYSGEMVSSLIEVSGVLETYPNLEYLPINFIFLTLPLFYLYVHKVSVFKDEKINYSILIPGILEISICTLLLFINREGLLFESLELLFHFFILLFIVPFNLLVLIMTFRLINRHTKLIAPQYAFNGHVSLKWCKNITLLLFLFLLIQLISAIFFVLEIHIDLTDLVISIADVFLIYWISIKGLEQKSIQLLAPSNNALHVKKNRIHDAEEKERIDSDFVLIHHAIRQKKLFKQVDLSILDVSELVGLQTKRISRAINLRGNHNFSNYINSLRITEAKQMLKDPKYNYLSVEGIGVESGFNSKSAFYKAFKNKDGVTPGIYRNDNTLGFKVLIRESEP